MGLLSDAANRIPGIGGKKRATPTFEANDFPDGMEIVEIIDGREATKDKILLVGSLMPHVPFKFGGTQQIVKDYYPGSSEPAVQVLGPRESDQTIKGRLTSKHIRDESQREAALEYQELIDAMRIRGNLVRITMGPWQRYGFIEEVDFELKRVTDIGYEIKFVIVGFNMPVGYKFTLDDTDPIAPNKKLTNALVDLEASRDAIPGSISTSIFDDINGLINGVATAVNKVTSFVDGVVDDVQKLDAAANRTIGMIRYARAYISKTNRTLSLLIASIRNTPAIGKSEAQKTKELVNNINAVNRIRGNNFTLAALLAELQSKFAAIAKTVPMVRHQVRDGDTLQKLSVKYYNDADQWQAIFKHNKLRSTVLTVGMVLEIPKI